MTPTLRRLNDRERYFGLTWPGWFAAATAGALVYGAIELSPFGLKPTITIVLLLLGLVAMVVLAVSGQALSPRRHLSALIAHRMQAKTWTLAQRPDRRGLVLVDVPDPEDEAEAREPVAAESLQNLAAARLELSATNGSHIGTTTDETNA
jgi:hypothetical protein